MEIESQKDYVLQIKIKNAPMLRIMRLNGFETAAALSRACGFAQGSIGRYLNLKQTPINKMGKWRKDIVKIADYLKVTPDFLFPEQHLTVALKRNTIEEEVTLGDIAGLIGPGYVESPEHDLIQEGETKLLEEHIGRLYGREQKVLRKRFGFDGNPATLEAIADDFSVSKTRIMQIEKKALEKLQKSMAGIYNG